MTGEDPGSCTLTNSAYKLIIHGPAGKYNPFLQKISSPGKAGACILSLDVS